jgi:hypothetical protein
MTWLNPWAWLGLASLAVPLVIHLLTRAQPTPQPFPTLRFLATAATTAVRRRAIRDRLVLAIRMAIAAAVVAACAQPYVRTRARQLAVDSALSRAVVLDTSASLQRISPGGRAAIDEARDRASRLEPAATATVVIEGPRLPVGLARARTWLEQEGGRKEIVVLSDFQRGAIAQADLSRVPDGIGVRLVKIDEASTRAAVGPAARIGDRVWTPRLTLDADRTTVAWSATPQASELTHDIRITAGPGDAPTLAAATAASAIIGAPAERERHPMALVLPNAAERSALLGEARPVDQPWMFETIDRLRHDAALAAASGRVRADRSTALAGHSVTVLARDRTGAPLLEAACHASASGSELLVFSSVADGADPAVSAPADNTLFVAALLAALARTRTDASSLAELEPVTLTPQELARWERPTPKLGSAAARSPQDADSRWFWIAALLLLALEGGLRRTTRHPDTRGVTHARVA